MNISIVIPTYNREKLLEETLNSIFCQVAVPLEVIVIDDNSLDNTLTMLAEYAEREPRLSYYVKGLDVPKGPAASKNIGALKAIGTHVHFFDSDDLVCPDFYENIQNHLLTGDQDALAVRIKWFNGNKENVTGISGEFSRELFLARAITREHELWTQNIIWRREFLLSQPHLHDELLTMSEDIEFACRMIVAAKSWDFSNNIFVLVRRHEESLTYQSSLDREVEIAISRYRAYKSIADSVPEDMMSGHSLSKCGFIIRSSVIFVLKIKGFNGFVRGAWLGGFGYARATKWPGYIFLLMQAIMLFVKKRNRWQVEGGYGRAN